MTPITLPKILIGAALALGLIGAIAFGVSHFAGKAETKAEIQSHVDHGVALTHAQNAEQIPSHDAVLQSTSQDVARARAKVARVDAHLAAIPSVPIPVDPSQGQALPQVVDSDPGVQGLRDALAAQRELTTAQDAQIQALQSALTDETKRSTEYRLAYEAESRRAAGLEIALAAQKHVSASDKWLGRVQGFAVGVALGYVGGKR